MNCGNVKRLAAAAVTAVTMSAGGAFAQDTAYVPFRVNVDARVTAVQGEKTVSIDVTGRTSGADTLKLPLGGANSVRYTGGAQGRLNAPVVTGSRGNITLRLPAQSYQNAEVALYTANGKRILRGKAAAAEASSAIARRNVAAGVYMLSVKGIDGNAFTARLTHNGGNFNINAAFGNKNALIEKPLAKKAGEEWEIRVSAVEERYKDYTYTLNNLMANRNNPAQVINLTTSDSIIYGNLVNYGDETYQTVVIGTQTWFARNLNYDIPDVTSDVCYNNVDLADNCAKYGRLYNWSTARTACPMGWHLPSDAEWTTLTDYVGGASTAGTKLKASTGWFGVPGTDDYGFSALPGGLGSNGGIFLYASDNGYWWSTTENDASYAWYRYMNYDGVDRNNNFKSFLFSVRCVQD